MPLDFAQKVVIVTGAGGGLGRSYALEFGRRGAFVVVNDLGGNFQGEGSDSRPAQNVVREITQNGGTAVADFHSVEEGEKIVKTAIDNFGRVDIVVNNAGILRDRSFVKMSNDDWDRIYRVHLEGTFKVTRAAWNYMREQNYGRIVNITSAAGLYGNYGQANYSAMKMAIVGFTKTLAKEGEKYNIKLNTIAPIAGSRMTETVLPPNFVDALRPEFVTPMVVYLSHETCEETGSIFELGGGWVSKVRWQRSQGYSFAKLDFKAEDVAENFEKISDFSNPTYPTSPEDAFGPIVENLKLLSKL